MRGGGWRKFSEKVTSYYDPPYGAYGAGFHIMTPHVDLIFLDSDYDPPYEISVALPELLTFERNKDFFIGIDLGVQETVFFFDIFCQ